MLSLCALLGGCKKKTGPSKPPICKAEVAGSEAEEAQQGDVPPDIWFLIMLQNFDRDAMQVKRPVKDCSGRPIEAEAGDDPNAACMAGENPAARLPDRPLVEEDLQLTPTDDGRQIVWVRTGRFDNGEAVGPIAITDWTKRGVAVRALGTLRAFEQKAAMHLEGFGEKDKVLVVESRVCDPEDPKDCWRVMRLLPLLGDYFVDKPMVAEDGTCLGPALFRLYDAHEVELANGTARKFEVSRSVDFTEGNVVISESVTIKDRDPKQPDAPAVLFRKANLERPLVVSEAGLQTKEGLWEKMIAEHGSVEVRPDPKPEEDAEAKESDAPKEEAKP